MEHDALTTTQLTVRESTILRLLEDLTARRLKGEDIPDEAIIADHADLMPELGDKLQALSSAERARRIAGDASRIDDSWTPNGAGDTLRDRATPFDRFRGYEVREVAGRGGMGVVYKALQTATNREVAIKVMFEGPLAASHHQERFEREARILAQLKHPNIVTVHDTGSSAGRFYLVMDYIDGKSLDAHMAEAKPPIRRTLELFAKICEAVSAAHLRGVIHRDLKPSNIRIEAGGEPQLLDFGLATVTSQDEGSVSSAHAMTMTGQFVGSLPWASPEQAQGASGAIDLRTDVYSLGVILYQLLTGRFPYSVVGNIRDVIDNILTADPGKPSTIDRQIDNEVETIMLKCLAKEPERRYQSAGDLARDVRRYLAGEPISAKQDSGWYLVRKAVRRYRVAVSVVAGFLFLSIAFSVTMSVLYRRAQNEAQRTRQTLEFLQDTLFAASSKRLGSDATLVEALDQAERDIATRFSSQPQIEAALRYTLGSAYETLWQKDRAVKHLRIARDLNSRTLGPEHAETMKCTVLLGMVLAELRQPEAVELQREALRVRLKRHGNQSELVAQSKSELAFSLFAAANPPRWEEAESYFQQALELYSQTLGPEHEDIARSLHEFAAMRQFEGKLEEAEHLFRRSLAMSRKLLGDDHQFVMECKRDFADVLKSLGKFDEAQSLMEQVLAGTSRLFGKTWVPFMLRQMASLQRAKGDLPAAEEMIRKALAVDCEQLADRHPDQAERLMGLAGSLLAYEAPPVGRHVADSASPTTTHPPYCQAVVAMSELGQHPHPLPATFTDLVAIIEDRYTADEAEPLLRECVDVLEQSGSQPTWFAPHAMSAHGRCLIELGRYGEAETVLTGAYTTLSDTLGESHARTTGAIECLINLYEQTGRPDMSAEYRRLWDRLSSQAAPESTAD
ncbi:MAG: serine/threonine-protein kinase [Planctomycetota bacterium]|jgi:serine/threonine protein kinase